MAARQLDILAIEPYYGGVRRAMMEALVRCSRHRWTLLKLPARRLERRLTTAANWFHEQIGRNWAGRIDLLFTSEALNLAHLHQLNPDLAKHPAVVYFHDNQLPDLSRGYDERETDLVNLSTAQAAAEVWFNSAYHKQTFLIRARALVDRHPELKTSDPMDSIAAKSRLMPTPIDLGIVEEVQAAGPVQREPRTMFVDIRDGNIALLNGAVFRLRQRSVPFKLLVVGTSKSLDARIPRTAIPELNDWEQVKAMLSAGLVISIRPEAASDYMVMRALLAGCRPILPDAGCYPEILPAELHGETLYDPSAGEMLADRVAAVLSPSRGPWGWDGFRQHLRPYDAIAACRAIDERIEQLVGAKVPNRKPEVAGQS